MKSLKSNPRITYKMASRKDVEDFLGAKIPYTMKSLIFYNDGKPVALGGWKLEDGNFIIFSDYKPTKEIPSLTVFRCGKIVLDFCREVGVPMYVVGGNTSLFDKLGMTKIEEGFYTNG